MTMDDFYTCPKKPDDIMPMVCYVRDSIQEVLWRHHIVAQVKVAPVECKVGTAGWGRVGGGGFSTASAAAAAVCLYTHVLISPSYLPNCLNPLPAVPAPLPACSLTWS